MFKFNFFCRFLTKISGQWHPNPLFPDQDQAKDSFLSPLSPGQGSAGASQGLTNYVWYYIIFETRCTWKSRLYQLKPTLPRHWFGAFDFSMPKATGKFYAVRSGRYGPVIYDSFAKVRIRVTNTNSNWHLRSLKPLCVLPIQLTHLISYLNWSQTLGYSGNSAKSFLTYRDAELWLNEGLSAALLDGAYHIVLYPTDLVTDKLQDTNLARKTIF